MAIEHEQSTLRAVESRLSTRFPTLGAAEVHRAVETSYGQLTGPIRDFVPLLVEHGARDTLTQPAERHATSKS